MAEKKNRRKMYAIIGVVLVGIIIVVLFFPLVRFRTVRVNGNAGIAATHPPANYNRGKLEHLPGYDENNKRNSFQVDLRSTDLSGLDLSSRLKDLSYANYDSKTVWPASLPVEFNPRLVMDLGKNPGLNIRKLHQDGVTGKGVSIAILDQMLLTDHKEYKDNLKFYEEIHAADEGSASMHGSAVSSIALGKSVGVAPEANLYYIAEANGNFTFFGMLTANKWAFDFRYLAESVNRIVELNKTLPVDQKIRVISMSVGWMPQQKGYKEIDEAVKRAKDGGILVLSTVTEQYYGINLLGLERNPFKDADDLNSYGPGLFLQDWYYSQPDDFNPQKTIWAPMGSRCTAAPTGNEDYAFYRSGGLSWTVPYLSGLYALCCQVKPDITPEQFLAETIATGDTITIVKDGQNRQLGTIPNPERLIEKLRPSHPTKIIEFGGNVT
ncbi:MAG: S8/S53 family peptidase [Syntrophomonas sp.]